MRRFFAGDGGLGCSSASGVVATMIQEGDLSAAGLGAGRLDDRSCDPVLSCCGSGRVVAVPGCAGGKVGRPFAGQLFFVP